MRREYDFYITPEEYIVAESNGISKQLLESRVRRLGWSKEKAMKEPVRIKGEYSKWYKIAESNGISKRTFIGRIKICGWSFERAATEKVKDVNEVANSMAESRRKYSEEIYKILEINGISRKMFYARIHRGWTIERAMTEKKRVEKDTRKNKELVI